MLVRVNEASQAYPHPTRTALHQGIEMHMTVTYVISTSMFCQLEGWVDPMNIQRRCHGGTCSGLVTRFGLR